MSSEVRANDDKTVRVGGDRIVVDAKGFTWRVWDSDEAWSMARVNPDNSPVPFPATVYVPVAEVASYDEAVASLKPPLSIVEIAAQLPDHMRQEFWSAVAEVHLRRLEREVPGE